MNAASSPAEEVLASLQTSLAGLTAREAASRLEQYGPNQLTRIKPVSALALLRDQFKSVVVLLLLAAAAVAIAHGDRVEAAAIAAVLLINTAIGFLTELRARRAMESLLRLDRGSATVIRDGMAQDVDAHSIVPGDIMLIEAGASIAADARVLAGSELRMNEAALTGESMPVSKDPGAFVDAHAPLGDRRTMVYKGTMASSGTARAVVTATGANTELGRIGTLVAGVKEERTPLEIKLDALGRRLIWISMVVAVIVALLGLLQGAGRELVIQTALALAIAAVPEALPTVVTIALAVGMRRMARRHAIVRRLPAVETLGSTTVVCTDKTLTLTTGDMTLSRAWVNGREMAPDDAPPRFLESGALASGMDDPLDAAILKAAARLGTTADARDRLIPVRATIPFSTARKLTASFREREGSLAVFVKGAPERVLELSSHAMVDGRRVPLDERVRETIREANAALAREGLRVLAFASGEPLDTGESSLRDLTLEGLAGFVDPPAAGVKEAIAALKLAGLETIMITGDQRLTAEAIARNLGVARVHSRVSPEEKLQIIEALQKQGAIVAMLGDGINDAAALRRADVGVAMGGRGTDVAKEAAAIVLQDDRFETVAVAVEEGRVIYANIRKFVFYLFSCNLAEVLVLLAAGVAALPAPLAPLHLLWLNMLTDTFPALALAVEPAERNVMREPPRDPREALLSRRFLSGVLVYALLITAATLTAFAWALRTAPGKAGTIAFMTLAIAQVLHLGNARSARSVIAPASVVSNPWALGAAAFAIALQLATVAFAPLRDVLDLVWLAPRDWIIVAACAIAPAVIGQAAKVFSPRATR